MELSLEEIKLEIINRGIKEVSTVYNNEKDQHKMFGSLQGFEITKNLNTPEDFDAALEARYDIESGIRKELRSNRSEGAVKEYWQQRYTTLQIEHVYERMKVLWNKGPTFSARAVMQVHDVLDSMRVEDGTEA